MKEEGIVPKKFIMFTDGYPWGEWGDENYCDTLFVVKGNERAESPFGQTVIYEKDPAVAQAAQAPLLDSGNQGLTTGYFGCIINL